MKQLQPVILFSCAIMIFIACEQTPKKDTTETDTIAQPETKKKKEWTKPMMYSVDAERTYYDDPGDADFSDNSEIFEQVFDAIYAGELTAYDFLSGEPLSIEKVKEIGSPFDTVFVPEEEPPYGMKMKVLKKPRHETIFSAKFKEKWHFNTKTNQLEKKVLGMAPRIPVYSQSTKEFMGYTPLFWVYFDEATEAEYTKPVN